MKTIASIGFGLCLLAAAGCSRSERYEFHPMQGGVGMWRCDKKTGLVEMTTIQSKTWVPVTGSQLPDFGK